MEKIEKGEVCLVIHLLLMQIIKSCRCGTHYAAKSHVFADISKALIQVSCVCRSHVKWLWNSLIKKEKAFRFPLTAVFHLASYFIPAGASNVSHKQKFTTPVCSCVFGLSPLPVHICSCCILQYVTYQCILHLLKAFACIISAGLQYLLMWPSYVLTRLRAKVKGQ